MMTHTVECCVIEGEAHVEAHVEVVQVQWREEWGSCLCCVGSIIYIGSWSLPPYLLHTFTCTHVYYILMLLQLFCMHFNTNIILPSILVQ